MLDRQTSESLFLEHRAWIDRVAAMICSQHGVRGQEAEDFVSFIGMKVMEDDYAIIRKFRRESTVRTYLATVVTRQFHDYWRERLGRWRTSAAAQRLGPPAPELEALVYRDGWGLSQAGEKLRTEGHTALSDAELARLLDQLPARTSLRPVEVPPDDVLNAAEGAYRADDRVAAAEAAERRERVMDALGRALHRLDAQDQVIVKMHFRDGESVADVARALNLDQKQLYRRVERLRTRLLGYLQDDGVHRDDVDDVVGGQGEE